MSLKTIQWEGRNSGQCRISGRWLRGERAENTGDARMAMKRELQPGEEDPAERKRDFVGKGSNDRLERRTFRARFYGRFVPG